MAFGYTPNVESRPKPSSTLRLTLLIAALVTTSCTTNGNPQSLETTQDSQTIQQSQEALYLLARKEHQQQVSRSLDRKEVDPLESSLRFLQEVKSYKPPPTVTPSSTHVSPTAVTYPTTSVSSNVTLTCIRAHESGGNYEAVNSLGYGGAYQLSPTYSGAWASRYGYSQWASVPAQSWPPSVQDAVALQLGLDSNWHTWSDFGGYYCPGF